MYFTCNAETCGTEAAPAVEAGCVFQALIKRLHEPTPYPHKAMRKQASEVKNILNYINFLKIKNM